VAHPPFQHGPLLVEERGEYPPHVGLVAREIDPEQEVARQVFGILSPAGRDVAPAPVHRELAQDIDEVIGAKHHLAVLAAS
jgi:hypothetical protein